MSADEPVGVMHAGRETAMPNTPQPDDDAREPASGRGEVRIAKALAHPLRGRILQRLGERVASPRELAEELNAPLGVVAYHVRMLRDYGCVELVRTQQQRGALQRFYRATTRSRLDEDQRRSLPSALRRELTSHTLNAVVEDLNAAANSGGLRGGEEIITRAPLELDPRARAKLDGLLARTHEGALAIAAESAQRAETAAPGADQRFPTELVLMHFTRARARPA
jgi:DNA-binding transcriptional ArsR family regulator